MINKAKIIDVKINNKNLRYKISSSFSKNLIGEKILNISRRSKYLILHFKNKILLIHFGMTGKFLLIRSKNNQIFKTSFYYWSAKMWIYSSRKNNCIRIAIRVNWRRNWNIKHLR